MTVEPLYIVHLKFMKICILHRFNGYCLYLIYDVKIQWVPLNTHKLGHVGIMWGA